MANIKVSGEQLSGMGDQIKTLSGELTDIIGEASTEVENMSAVWEGVAQAAFYADFKKQQQTLAKLGEAVDGLATQVKSVAEAWDQLESGLSARG